MIDLEPLIVSELERMLPLPDGARADWSDVLRRADFMRARRRGRPVLVTAVVVAALVGVGVAIAAGFGAFNGISAAQRPQTAADKLDPKLLAEINTINQVKGGPGRLLPNSARLVRQLPDARIYAVATNDGQLCVLATRLQNSNGKYDAAGMGCGSPLTQSQPTTAASFKPNQQMPTISWGIALDGVTAVSFIVGGEAVTVPVVNNVWVYQGNSGGVLESLTAHFADGHTETIP